LRQKKSSVRLQGYELLRVPSRLNVKAENIINGANRHVMHRRHLLKNALDD
jgi:hypothetical protein